jgi:hypothetical protein
MPFESFRPEFHQIDEFNFDSAFVNSDNSASHSLGQTNLRKIRPSFRDGPFGLFRRSNLIAPSRFLQLDLPSISIREHINRAGFKLPADTGDTGHRPRGRKVFHVWEEGLSVFIRYFATVDSATSNPRRLSSA